ncbi:MAG: hypothetical protein QOE46_333 [Acidobacteriota bacterium]|jgi:uncharacterized membrane protein|nr:hypothetical protein [Acidobacteriota bacterium]
MAEEQSTRELLAQLVERLEHLERVLQSQTARLYAVERRLGLDSPTPAPRRPLYELPPGEFDAARMPPTAAPRETQAPPPFPPSEPGEQRPPAPEAKKRDLESVIGGSWFSWVGIIAVTFGVAFALKYAFENEWVGPGARVALGALAGLALLGTGERLRQKGLRPFAYVLSGGGVLILYLSIYAAYDFYQLLAQPFAFLLMTLVTAGAVLLSVRSNALPIAVLGLVGGFLTPVLISTGQDNQLGLFTYVALLDAGVLSVGYFKRWRSLDFLSFLGTVALTLGWADKFYNREKLWPTLFFITVFFILYALLAVFHNVLPRRRSRWFDVALLVWNATLYFGFSYLMLDGAGYEHTLPASHALVVSAFFTLLFYAAWSRCREDRLLAYAYVGAAVVFFTVALAIQLELQWVTIAWAVEGLTLTWLGLRSGVAAARRAAVGVFAFALMHWVAFDAREFAYAAGGDFIPLFNGRALSCAVLVGALAASAWLYRRARFEVESSERGVLGKEERETAATLYALAANGLAVTLLTLDLSDYFGRRRALSQGLEAERAENARQFSLTALWSIYGAMLFAYGARRVLGALRYAGLALLAGATVKVLTFDLAYYDAAWHVPVFNHTFMAFALVVAAYALAVRLYARDVRDGTEHPSNAKQSRVVPVLIVVANLLAIVALSAEAAGYFASGRGGVADAVRLHDLNLAKQLSLSVVWAVYGAGLLVAGRVRRSRLLRLLALALLVVTTLKVFLLDLSALDSAYRIVSFIVLGAILLAVSYLYQKSQQRAAAEEADQTS